MMQWEYKRVFDTHPRAEAMMNKYGQEGWEATSVDETGHLVYVWFKRPVIVQ